jgi:soluble lytic murein transglycosylase
VTRRGALGIVLGAAFVAGAWAGWERGGPPDLSRHAAAIGAASRESGVPADLLRAMVAAESGGDPAARSRAGARGLMQLLPSTAREQAERLHEPWRGDDALDDPAWNVRLGAGYLAWLLARFDGQVDFAIAAYNAGPEPVKRWRRRAVDVSAADVVLREGYDETRRYFARVREHRRRDVDAR